MFSPVLPEVATAFETERLFADPLRVPDAEEMAEVLGDERLHNFIGGHPLSREDLRHRYARWVVGRSADGREWWFNWVLRLRESQVAIGSVQATLSDLGARPHANIAWVIGVHWQRRGFASEATAALVAWLGRCGITRVSANIHADHVASQNVALRSGLSPTDEYIDGERVWGISGGNNDTSIPPGT